LLHSSFVDKSLNINTAEIGVYGRSSMVAAPFPFDEVIKNHLRSIAVPTVY